MIGQILSPISVSKKPARIVPAIPSKIEILEPNRKATDKCNEYKNN